MPDEEQRRIALDSTDLDIVASDAHVYDVTITHQSGAETRHSVSVPEDLLAELGVSAAQEPLLVRASLIYLMEHVPAAVPERFGLDEIGRAVPAYGEDILGRI
jgi:hypothetical protein